MKEKVPEISYEYDEVDEGDKDENDVQMVLYGAVSVEDLKFRN